MAEESKGPPAEMLEDSKLAAFLKLKGHRIVAYICRDYPGDVRVGFMVEGDEETKNKSTQAYYDNEQVGIQDYIRCLAEVKSQMYNMRKMRRPSKP